MNYRELQKLNEIIENLKSHPNSDENIQFVLDLADNTIKTETLKQLITLEPPITGKQENKREENFGILTFTKKELSTMPKAFQKSFLVDNRIGKFRYYEGLFQARYRRDGFNIEVASKDFDTMKQKFMQRLSMQAENPEAVVTGKRTSQKGKIPTFAEFGETWLLNKRNTTKERTYLEYERLVQKDLNPRFGNFKLTELNRQMLQDFLFEYTAAEKHRTAQKLKQVLGWIFDLATEDYGIKSPVNKIVLPYYETKKGSAFTKKEERELVDYCIANPDGATTSAILVLLYFGLRQGELKSLRLIDDNFLDCITGKGRFGREEEHRQIPITPVARKVLMHIDFEKAKHTNLSTIGTLFARNFPNHRPHDLRYTFITRCKECNVNHELVMIWDGHKDDKDVKTSKVDRGYTDYSKEYILSEAEKVNYTY